MIFVWLGELRIVPNMRLYMMLNIQKKVYYSHQSIQKRSSYSSDFSIIVPNISLVHSSISGYFMINYEYDTNEDDITFGLPVLEEKVKMRHPGSRHII
jgi:hypothetical protein